jgi:hypothetical protein
MYTARVTVVAPVVLLNPHFTNSVFASSAQTLPGKTYFLESTPSLAPASWVAGAGIAGDGTVRNFIDPNPTNAHTFYRLLVQ